MIGSHGTFCNRMWRVSNKENSEVGMEGVFANVERSLKNLSDDFGLKGLETVAGSRGLGATLYFQATSLKKLQNKVYLQLFV